MNKERGTRNEGRRSLRGMCGGGRSPVHKKQSKRKKKGREGKMRGSKQMEIILRSSIPHSSLTPHPPTPHILQPPATIQHTYIHTSKSYRIVVYPIWYYYL